jgi:hypothetical protein
MVRSRDFGVVVSSFRLWFDSLLFLRDRGTGEKGEEADCTVLSGLLARERSEPCEFFFDSGFFRLPLRTFCSTFCKLYEKAEKSSRVPSRSPVERESNYL